MGWVGTWWDSRAVSEEEQLSICGHVCGGVCVRVCVRVHVCMLLHGSLPPLPSSVFCVWLCYLSPHQLWMAGEASGQEYVLTTVFCIGNRQNVAGRRPWGERCWSRQETGGKEKKTKTGKERKKTICIRRCQWGPGCIWSRFQGGAACLKMALSSSWLSPESYLFVFLLAANCPSPLPPFFFFFLAYLLLTALY